MNISLEDSVVFSMMAYHIDRYDCPEREAYWEIVRADMVIEVYIVLNDSYCYGLSEHLDDSGLSFFGHCFSYCDLYLSISPTDLRYNGALITGVLNLPECFSSPNITDTITLNIQGIIYCATYIYT